MHVKPFRFFAMIGLLPVVMPAQGPTPGEALSGKFAGMCQDFIHESLAASPASASQAGYHYHVDSKTGKKIALDALLDDMSPAGFAEQRRIYVHWRERFHSETPVASLGPEDAADWRLIDDQIALNLLEFDRIQNYKHNPTLYVELLGGALFQPLTDEYASEDVRVGHILSRIAGIPRFLEQVRSELVDADPIFIKVAVEENEGNINLINGPIAAAAAKSPELKARFERVSPAALKALTAFSEWLQSDLAKRRTDRTWRLGKELYAEKFRLVMETDITPEQVLAEAETAFRDTRAEMLELALPLHRLYYPGHDDHSGLSSHERENKIIG